jgi:phosphopantothenoylcysteine decarboxylase
MKDMSSERAIAGFSLLRSSVSTDNADQETGNEPVGAAGNIVLGVTGSIAAYKAVDLTSLLVKRNCAVNVVMTADAQRFITPLPFKVISRHPVITELYDEEEGWKPTHVKLADEANLLLIAPATANVIAKLAHGLADDALSCIALALNPTARMLIAPAMNGKMWLHPATQQNVAALRIRGIEFIGPEEGMLSCGYEGKGRLEVVEKICQRALDLLPKRSQLLSRVTQTSERGNEWMHTAPIEFSKYARLFRIALTGFSTGSRNDSLEVQLSAR